MPFPQLVVNPDPAYPAAENLLRARTTADKVRTIFDYLIPGIILFLLINTPLHDWVTGLTGWAPSAYQFWLLIALSWGWHLGYPVYRLRVHRGLPWREVWRTLSLHRFSVKGFFLFTPAFFLVVLLVAVPYMHYVFPTLNGWLAAVPGFAIPEHSIFSNYEALYNFSPWQMALLFIGNFVGEEVYFRGYLIKRSAFLGRHNWWIHSLLFSVYHFWQIPMTWALSFVSLAFGYWMLQRRNLWELILLHIMINLFLPQAVRLVFG